MYVCMYVLHCTVYCSSKVLFSTLPDTIKTRREFTTWREWRANELERDFKYCHPRWPQETEYLQSEIKGVRSLSFITDSDWWIYFDWVALVLILGTIVSHVTFFHFSTKASKQVPEFINTIDIFHKWWLSNRNGARMLFSKKWQPTKNCLSLNLSNFLLQFLENNWDSMFYLFVI